MPGYLDSCEVYSVDGTERRRIVYGLSREQLVADPTLLQAVLRLKWGKSFPWEDHVVITKTRRLSRGLPKEWRRTKCVSGSE